MTRSSADLLHRRRVAFLVNGAPDSAMGRRAAAFASRLGQRYELTLMHRSSDKIRSIRGFIAALDELGPAVTYVFDMSYSGVLAGARYRKHCGNQNRLLIDTGDAIYELARAVGRGPLGLLATRWLQSFSFKSADAIVVRGTLHQRLLAERGIESTVIQDGVETEQFASVDASAGPDVRRALEIPDDAMTIGIVGSSVWSRRQRTCYGWELVELLRLLKGEAVAGIFVGDGSGLDVLRRRAAEYGIEDRLHFLGRRPYDELPRLLRAMDVCLSTQTNDLPGRVRTTGKLPLYLAAGRYVLASDVGEASLVLPPEMRVPYDGSVDRAYPEKLAARVRELLRGRARLARGEQNVRIARERFDYEVLSARLAEVIDAQVATIGGVAA